MPLIARRHCIFRGSTLRNYISKMTNIIDIDKDGDEWLTKIENKQTIYNDVKNKITDTIPSKE